MTETVASLLTALGIDRTDHDEAVREALRELVQRRATEAKGARELALEAALRELLAIARHNAKTGYHVSPARYDSGITTAERVLALPSPPAAAGKRKREVRLEETMQAVVDDMRELYGHKDDEPAHVTRWRDMLDGALIGPEGWGGEPEDAGPDCCVCCAIRCTQDHSKGFDHANDCAAIREGR